MSRKAKKPTTPKVKGRLVNKAELAKIFGVTVEAVGGWIRNGLPCVTRGSPGRPYEFDTAAVVEWREGRMEDRLSRETDVTTLDEARIRKMAADASLAEYDLAEKRGEVVPVNDAGEMVLDAFQRVRAKLTSIPSKIAPLVSSTNDPDECRSLLQGAILEALAELAVDDGGPHYIEDLDGDPGEGPP